MTERASDTVPPVPRDPEAEGGGSPPGAGGGPPGPADVRRAWRLLAAMAVVGVVTDLGLRGGVVGLGSALALGTTAVALLATQRRRPPEAWALAGAAVVLAAFLALRTSPWIVLLDWAAVLGLLGLLATTRADVPAVGQSSLRLALRAAVPWLVWPASVIAGPVDLATTLHRRPRAADAGPRRGDRRRRAGAVARGLLLAVPIVVVVGLLLGSADAVFASFFDVPVPDLGLGDLGLHLVLGLLGAGVLVALATTAEHVPPASTSTWRPLGAVEATVVLIGLTGLYSLFAVAQVVAAVGGDERVQRTTDLTYAEYARSGFFQLLWAAGVTLVVLLGIRAAARDASPRQDLAVRVTSAACCGLTLVVVLGAVNRLAVYRDAYGLTMLRWACTTFAWFLGATFVLLAVRSLQGRRGRDWLPVAMAGTALVALVWWNASDPEAHVARTNIARAEATGKLDVGYADGMSDDAVPTLVAGLDDLDGEARDALWRALCTPEPEDLHVDWGRPHVEPEADGSVEVRDGWAAGNLSRSRAAAAVEACPAR